MAGSRFDPPSHAREGFALEQIRAALLSGVCPGVVLMDASYGSNSALRGAITGFGLSYVAAIVSTVKVRPVSKGDRKPRRLSVEALAFKLSKHARQNRRWCPGQQACERTYRAAIA